MVIFDEVTHSSEETHELAQQFARKVKVGSTVFIEGELGAGKTEFVRGFVVYHGIDLIRSPSFTVVFEHKSKYGYPIYHIDLYRFEGNFMELLERGIIDIFEKEDGIVLVEWADRVEKFYKSDFRVKINRLSETDRQIVIEQLM